jgi:hypothetical protein
MSLNFPATVHRRYSPPRGCLFLHAQAFKGKMRGTVTSDRATDGNVQTSAEIFIIPDKGMKTGSSGE